MTWPTVPLADLTTVISSGSTPLGGSQVYLKEGPVLFIRSQNVLMGSLSLDDPTYISRDLDAAIARTRLEPGDVLLNITGASIGRTALFDLANTPANVNQHVCVLRPLPSRLHPGYLMAFLMSPRQQAHIDRIQAGGTRQALTFSQIAQFEIPVPPLPEQRRIAAILDHADALRAKRRAAIAKLDSLAQSIFLDMFGDPVSNNRKWNRLPLSEILTCIESGSSPVCLDRPRLTDDEWAVLKLGAITWCEYDFAQNKALPPKVKPDTTVEVMKGDLLFARKNTHELVAACALVHDTPPRLLLPDLIFRLKLRESAPIFPGYLHQLLIHPGKRREIQKLAGGSAGSMPNISKSNLMTVQVECPPISMQQSYVEHLARVQRTVRGLRDSLNSLERLFCSLQNRAFLGEL